MAAHGVGSWHSGPRLRTEKECTVKMAANAYSLLNYNFLFLKKKIIIIN